MTRFVAALARRGHARDFQFFSLEWYPFDAVCGPTAAQLVQEPGLLSHALARLHREGLPRTVPCFITEYGYSAFAGQVEMELPSAMLNADIAAQFLELGGTTAYLYGLEPNSPIREVDDCPTWGNLALFLSDKTRHIRQPLPAFWSERMLTRDWAQSTSDGRHDIYAVLCQSHSKYASLSAYAVRRPDRQWAVLLINKNPHHVCKVRLRFRETRTYTLREYASPVEIVQYGPAQYRWHPNRAQGYASPDLPPVRRTLPASAARALSLPPYSLTVVTGQFAPFTVR